ncbi:hypothetical protein [Thiocapsa sp. N5-Cardenillas]|uniref:hypothetical protein n=1 Tax=Thiocapsa sp. N5-Cardenillas TaxID=3137397 RepID=UPI0035AD8582
MMSQAMCSGAITLGANAYAGQVEHEAFERANAGAAKNRQTSDHRPVSLELTPISPPGRHAIAKAEHDRARTDPLPGHPAPHLRTGPPPAIDAGSGRSSGPGLLTSTHPRQLKSVANRLLAPGASNRAGTTGGFSSVVASSVAAIRQGDPG